MENNLVEFQPALNVGVGNFGSIELMAPINVQDLWKTQISEIVMQILLLIRFQGINGSNNDQYHFLFNNILICLLIYDNLLTH